MMPWIVPIIFIIIILVAIAAIPAFKIKQEEFKRTGKRPKGHFMGMGIALGIPLGIPIGLALGNIAFGPAIGVAIGTAIGAFLEQKHKDELRPLTEKEKEVQKRAALIGAGILVLGLLMFSLTFFMVIDR